MRNWINVERAKRKMTQEELAKVLKINRHSVNAIETGRYTPSAIIALRIARYFNVKVEDIFFIEDEEYYLNQD